MANVLGELFAEIANAIRGKTGEDGTMRPIDFPARISNISTRDVSGMSLKFVKDDFKPTSTEYVIEHNLGVIPDIFIVTEYTHSTEQKTGNMLKSAVGYGTKMMELLKNVIAYPGCTTYAMIYKYEGDDHFNSTTRSVGDDSIIVECTDNQQIYGTLRSATSTTIRIGGTNSMIKLDTNTDYQYIAIGGLF